MSQSGSINNSSILPDIETITGTVGGIVGPDALHNINLLGVGGVTVTGTPGTNTLTIAVAGTGLTWSREVNAAVPIVVNYGYINTNAGLTTFTLPALSAIGDIVEIVGESAGLWTIAQNAGQNIQVGNVSTTIGIGGSIIATNRYDTVRIVCRVANTTWSTTGYVGALNVI